MTALTLKRIKGAKRGKIVGRGSSRGKTSGRGTKGQKARAGHRIRPAIRDAIKKLPKLRGRGKNSNKAFRLRPAAVNLAALERHFDAGAKVTPAALAAKGLIARNGGALPTVKVLAEGGLTKALSCYDCLVSAAARKKIEAAGGTVTE